MNRKARMLAALCAALVLIAMLAVALGGREETSRAAAPSITGETTTSAPGAPTRATRPTRSSTRETRLAPPACGPLETTGEVVLRSVPDEAAPNDGFGFSPGAVVRCLEQGIGDAAGWYCVLAVVENEEDRKLLGQELRSGWLPVSVVKPAAGTADVGTEPVDIARLCDGR
jgi:hypothetical protein